MSWQRIELNMIPDTKVLPVVHASQFDSKRSISFQMFTGEDEWIIPEGLTIELHCRKVDDNIVTLAPFSVDGSVITFITNEQLTACSGQNKCELSFIDANDLVIGSLNFILDVEPDPLKGGLTSASSIYDLTQQIEDIAQEVIGEDYYNKTETDALLADKADISDIPDMSNYYKKAQTYSSSQIDTALSYKADRSELTDYALKDWVELNFVDAAYLSTHYYNKNQVDDLLIGLMPVGSASGNPCSFNTEIAASLQALTANIVCGGGGGTPSAPIPLVGHSELNLTRCGKNLWTLNDSYTVAGAGYLVNNSAFYIPKGTYNFNYSTALTSGAMAFSIKDSDGNALTTIYINNGTNNGSFTIAEDGRFVSVYSNTAGTYTDLQINLGSTVLPYAPYNGQTFTVAFGQTVYGGVYDKSGRLTITHKVVDLETLSFTYVTTWFQTTDITDIKYVSVNTEIADCKAEQFTMRMASDMSSSTAGQCAVDTSNVKFNTGSNTDRPKGLFCYELATPIVIDVPSISVFAENGTNNIVSDCGGDVSVSYKDTIQHYIDTRL